ncbi:MAG: alanine racemase [Candidatus Eisenbacteria bacterium]|nr:alanine racemase [Candidatus Eisenbacteria bacterium]
MNAADGIPEALRRIVRPTLILDRARALRNIDRMAEKARRAGVRLRPHFKTHQSPEIGSWFRERGVTGITVSSVRMAERFAAAGWKDITIAFPVNVLEMNGIRRLARRIRLGLLVDAEESFDAVERDLDVPVGIWIKVDVGPRRSGVSWDRPERIASLAGRVGRSRRHALAGILTHDGRTYAARSPEEILRLHAESLVRMARARESASAAAGGAPLPISVGDTPSCALADRFDPAEEIRPGNFVFYDAMQMELGSCAPDEIAVAVACPVVGRRIREGELVLYGGAVHFAKESVVDREGRTVYGYLGAWEEGGFGAADARAPILQVSQEHSVAHVGGGRASRAAIGDLVPVIPSHSCHASALHRGYLTLEGTRIARIG